MEHTTCKEYYQKLKAKGIKCKLITTREMLREMLPAETEHHTENYWSKADRLYEQNRDN